jgi:hypothetical protein
MRALPRRARFEIAGRVGQDDAETSQARQLFRLRKQKMPFSFT